MVNQEGPSGAARLAAALAAILPLGACAAVERAFETPPVNPSSPIAAYAETVAARPFPKPAFSEVPARWGDPPTAAALKLEVVRQIQARRAVAAYWALHPPQGSETESWAALERQRIPAAQGAPVASGHDAESAAFARRLREEAARPQ